MLSIKRQLTRELLGAVLLLLGAGLGALYFAVRAEETEQFDLALEAKARAISTLTMQTAAGVRVDFSDRFLSGFEGYSPRDFFQIWDASGRELARSESLPPGKSLPRGPAPERRPGRPERPVAWNFDLPTGRSGRGIEFSFTPRAAAGQPPGAAENVHLVAATSRGELEETLWQLLGLFGGLGVLLVGSTLLIIPRVLRRGLVPLEQLAERASRIDVQSLGTRFVPLDLPAELQPIARQLNEALARLEKSFERERRFSADLAHEMRTPLAELRSMAECALKWPESRDPGVDRDTLLIAQQMERIVTHILALARGDGGPAGVELSRVELAPLVERICADFAPRAKERKLSFVLQLEPAAGLAEEALLRSVAGNLVENAVEYAVRGTAIELSLEDRGDVVALRVANATHELVEEDLSRMFDRFWRKDPARTSGTHAGLGLSLARGFATSMGWTLEVSLNRDRRVSFTLSGPRAADSGQRSSSPPLPASR